MTIPPGSHDGVRHRLAAFAAGLLEVEDEEQVRLHLEECQDCRSMLGQAEAGGLPGLHLPNSLVSHWAKRSPELQGLQRELVRRHLGRCGECRRALAYFGHEPVLKRVPAHEAGPVVVRMLEGRDPSGATGFKWPKWGSREFWVGSFVGGGLVTATAALLFVMNPVFRGAQSVSMAPGPDSSRIDQPLARLRLALMDGAPEGFVASLETGAITRSLTRPDTTITLTLGQRHVRIALAPETDFSPKEQVEVELRNHAGEVLDHASLPYRFLIQSDQGLALVGADSLATSDLIVRVSADKNRVYNYPIHLRK